MAAFDAERPWQLGRQVALRPEPFGALAYHFGTRRLSFLKSRALVGLVESLERHGSAREAVAAAGVPGPELPAYESALARLADTGMIEPRAAA
jgi:putative mycofactocin binding protein MftB